MTTLVKSTGWEVVSAGDTSTDWAPLPLGAGGWVTSMDIIGTTKVATADTYGLYRSVGTGDWVQLMTDTSWPTVLPHYGKGAYAARMAPTNPDIIYTAVQTNDTVGTVYKSTNAGTTWAATALTGKLMNSNNQTNRFCGYKMAVDPVNADVVWFVTDADGVYYTDDGGDTWTEQTDIATSNAFGYRVHYDTESTVSGGKTQKIYIVSCGTGVYRSTDAGATFTLMTGTNAPNLVSEECRWLHVHTDGSTSADSTVFVCGRRSLWRWDGTSWTVPINDDYRGVQSVAFDANDPDHIFGLAASGAGWSAQSDNNGVTWGAFDQTPVISSTDIAWHDHASRGSSWAPSNVISDSDGKIWLPMGIGTYYIDSGSLTGAGQSSTPWVGKSKGIEQLVVNGIMRVPDGPLVVYCWDRSLLIVNDDMTTYPTRYYPGNGLDATWDVEVFNDGSMATISRQTSGLQHSYATAPLSDIGNWSTLNMPAGTSVYSGIVAGDPNDPDRLVIAIQDGANGAVNGVYQSNNGGTTWVASTIPDQTNPNLVVHSYAFSRKGTVCCDESGNFFFYGRNQAGAAQNGFWKRAAGQDAWVKQMDRDDVGSGTFVYNHIYWSNFNFSFVPAPGKTDDLWFAGGHSGTGPDSATPESTMGLMRSTDGGATWTQITNVREVYKFGFGKEAPGSSYPAMYFAGWATDDGGSTWVHGIWMSTNVDSGATPTWTQIGDYPMGIMDIVTDVVGDRSIYGRVYVGFRGTGGAWRQVV